MKARPWHLLGKGLATALFAGAIIAMPVRPAVAETIAAFTADSDISEHVKTQLDRGSMPVDGLGEPAIDESEGIAMLSARAAIPFIQVNVDGEFCQSEAYKQLAIINAERASKGKAPLVWDASLEDTASVRAAEISLAFSHTRPTGEDCFTLFPSDTGAGGENILVGAASAQGAFDFWKTSPGHYENMTSDSFTKVGIACFKVSGGYWWVQCFGSANSSDQTPSQYDGAASVLVDLPDSVVTGVSWSAQRFTPGVDAVRALPSATVAFDGALANGEGSVSGTVTYDASSFSWSTDNPQVAQFQVGNGSLGVVGVATGSTTVRATMETTTKLDAAFPVEVTQNGAFTDVDGSTPHNASILWLSSHGITFGYPDGSFKPLASVARCDMAAFLRRLAVAANISDAAGWTPTADDWHRFIDVNQGTPHAEDVLWLAHAGISTGFPDGSFKPLSNIARCDMAAFLRRLAKLGGIGDAATWQPSGSDWAFTDVSGSTDHVNDVLWLAHAGISTGFPDGTFRPYNDIVRCDMAAFLQRLAE